MRHEKGQSSIEFAMVLPLVVIVFVVLVQAFVFIYWELKVCQAARDGAREGAVTNDNGRIEAAVLKDLRGNRDGLRIVIYPSSPSQRKIGSYLSVKVEKELPGLSQITRIFGGVVDVSHTASMRMERE